MNGSGARLLKSFKSLRDTEKGYDSEGAHHSLISSSSNESIEMKVKTKCNYYKQVKKKMNALNKVGFGFSPKGFLFIWSQLRVSTVVVSFHTKLVPLLLLFPLSFLFSFEKNFF